MRGDFSRIRFNRLKGYTAVLEQQGRVALDADANEQCLIDDYLRVAETVDVIGRYGGPIDDAGFAITIANGELEIGSGRYYVDGLLCENGASLAYDAQPYLLGNFPTSHQLLAKLLASAGKEVLQVYLEVWQRLVTVLDDPCLREPALGQADTTARLQTVWRVVAGLVPAREGPVTSGPAGQTPCCRAMYDAFSPLSTGRVSAGTSGPSADCGCEPVPAAGYQGVENQLYRVEIHQGGDETTATFKWSRENGSVASAVTAVNSSTITVGSLGPDANLGFQAQQWVELSDDTNIFGEAPNQPGTLYQVQSIQPEDPSLTLGGTVTPVDPAHNARVRRWDQTGPAATSTGIQLSAGTWIPLENGIQICFAQGTYKPGDYWTIPARTATGTIEWPPCGGDGNAFQSPQTVRVHRAPLACIHSSRGGRRKAHFTVDDCRILFNPLTALTGPATAAAMHVQSVSWTNDDITTLDQLVANGLTVQLDQAPSAPVNGANFIVTVEPVLAPSRKLEEPASFVAGQAAEFLPSTLLRGVTIVDAAITVSGQTLSWEMRFDTGPVLQKLTVLALDEMILPGATVGLWARARIKLLGQMIFAPGAAGPLFLDGRAFAQIGVRAEGTPRIDLQLPSGDGSKSSDLDSWFYLAPTLAIDLLAIADPAVTVVVDAADDVTGVTTADGQQVRPTATVYLNYPAVAAATITLAVTGATGAGSIASVAATTPITAGEREVTFPISILGNPGANTTLTFTLTATLGAATGPGSARSADFTVTGVQPPINIQ
jgi:Family of unknown function (DUF6519)